MARKWRQTRSSRQDTTGDAADALLTRGVLATRTGCNLETIRYYERIGLLPPPARSAGGHRLYGPDLVRRLGFVRRGRDLGFTIEEIRNLLRLVDGGACTCAEVEALARTHLHDIRRKIADLKRLERAFATLAAQCSGGAIPDCPIIDALFAPDACSRPAAPRAAHASPRARAGSGRGCRAERAEKKPVERPCQEPSDHRRFPLRHH